MIYHHKNFLSNNEIGRLLLQATNVETDEYADCFTRSRIPYISVSASFKEKISNFVLDINRNHYGFDMGNNITVERFLFAEYNLGDYCDIHHDVWDTMFMNDFVRKISAVVCLENTASGGELEFYYTNDQTKLGLADLKMQESYTLEEGDIIVFPSHIYHRVSNITSGKRKTVLALFTGPRFK